MKNFLCMLLLAANFTLLANQPLFKECANRENPIVCNSEKLQTLKEGINSYIVNSLGYFIEDSIYLRFTVSGEGDVKMDESFALVSNLALSYAERYLQDLHPQFEPTSKDEYFEIISKLQLPKGFSEYVSLNETDRYPTVEDCKSFNAKGKRACFRYLILRARDEMDSARPEDDVRYRVYFHKGEIVGLETRRPPLSKTHADRLVLAVNQELSNFINPQELKRSTDFHLDVNIQFYGDSLKRWEVTEERISYLKRLPQKEYALEALVSAKRDFFSKDTERGTEFLLAQLTSLGMDTLKEIRMNGHRVSLDSLRNFQKSPDSTLVDIMSFGMVESVPVFAGCKGSDENNEERKICFQRQILTFVSKNFEYPKKARSAGIQGKVYIGFVVEKDGSFDQIEIMRGAHPLLDFEAIRIVSEFPDVLRPAMQRGQPVRMSFTLPINARLE